MPQYDDTVELLRNALATAKAKLQEQNEFIKRVSESPMLFGVVLKVGESPDFDLLRLGTKVRVLTGSSMRNKVATITRELDRDGDIFLETEDGDAEYLRLLPSRSFVLTSAKRAGQANQADIKPGTSIWFWSRWGPTHGNIQSEPNTRGYFPVTSADGRTEELHIGQLHQISSIAPDEILGPRVVVAVDGKILEVNAVPDIEIKPGSTAKLLAETMQIVDIVEPMPIGEVSIVREVKPLVCEVDYQGSSRVVCTGDFEDKVAAGDRVVLDASLMVILDNLGKVQTRFQYTGVTGVTWEDVGGLVEAKRDMREIIEGPYQNSDLYQFYGKKPVKGVLLYGPPGCGKTLLAKASATALAQINGREIMETGFIYIKGPEILDRFVGSAEETIRQLFNRSREHKAKHGYPATIFIDEADAILGKRGSGISSDIERTTVPMFLTEMDGLDDSGALMLLATNRPDVLDPAVTRDGRVDRKIKIVRPDATSAQEIFLLNLRQLPMADGGSAEAMAALGSNELYRESRILYSIRLREGPAVNLTMAQIANGGMIAGIVDQATSLAIHRDRSSGSRTGVCASDIRAAVDKVFWENRDLNHDDAIHEFIEPWMDQVLDVRKVAQLAA